jgi:hypothetical protein
MIAIPVLVQALTTNYARIMDADRNPLWRLPPAQRFQTMIYLAIMWTTIFCAAFGLWFWYGELIVAHMLVAFGFVLTSTTFTGAKRSAMTAKSIRSRPVRNLNSH